MSGVCASVERTRTSFRPGLILALNGTEELRGVPNMGSL
jgi:hypothetical protein